MKNLNILSKLGLAVCMLSIFTWGCQPEGNVNPKGDSPSLSGLGYGDTVHVGDSVCGSIITGSFVDASGNYGSGNMFGADLYGSWNLLSTETEIVWQITLGRGWFVNRWWAWAEESVDMPKDANGQPVLEQFPYQNLVNPVRNYAECRLPVTAANTCPNSPDMMLCLDLVELDFLGNPYNNTTVWAEGTTVGSTNAKSISFCATPCGTNQQPVPCNLTAGAFRTQTQGGWGSRANGNNPGAYRDANWSTTFPNGITVGCSNYSVTLTSSAAVESLLPCGGPSRALDQSYTDPNRVQNVLVGQLVAAKLSVAYDLADANFGSSAQRLGNLVLQEGDFAGWSVNAVIAEADQVLGGCSTSSDARDLNRTLTEINENFVDGTMVGLALGCPPSN